MSSRRPSVASSASATPTTYRSRSCATAAYPYGEQRPCHWKERTSLSSLDSQGAPMQSGTSQASLRLEPVGGAQAVALHEASALHAAPMRWGPTGSHPDT